MCVRDLIRRRCQSSKKTFKRKLRQSTDCKLALPKRDTTEQRLLKREAVDLFCPEFLSIIDLQSCQGTAGFLGLLKDECRISSMTTNDAPFDVSSTSRPLDPVAFTASSSYCKQRHLKHTPWDEVEKSSWNPHISPREASRSNDGSSVDGFDWNDFCPDPGSTDGPGVKKQCAWQIEEAGPFASSGNSLQSNYLPCERWPIQSPGPFCSHYEKRGSSSDIPPARCYDVCQKNSTPINFNETVGTPSEHTFTSKFGETMYMLLEKESSTCYQLSKPYIEKLTENHEQKLEHNELRVARRGIVKWIFKVVGLLHVSALAAAHAVSFLDRFLSQRYSPQAKANTDLRLAATACIWIAAKMEDSDAPDLSSIRRLSLVEYDDEKVRKMEVCVLKSLGWRMLAVTASDFLANMVAQLPAFGLPMHLLRPVGHRSEEIIQGILSEVAFLAYQPSVLSISVMQCLLDECVPVHTASLMAAFHLALAVDVELEKVCHRTVVDLVVDPYIVCSLPSPDRVDSGNSEGRKMFVVDIL